jgi:hypothetical protein
MYDLIIPPGLFDKDPDEFYIAVAYDLATKGFYFMPKFIEESLEEWLADMTPKQRTELDRRLEEYMQGKRK